MCFAKYHISMYKYEITRYRNESCFQYYKSINVTFSYFYHNSFQSIQVYMKGMLHFVYDTCCLYSLWDTIYYNIYHIPHVYTPNMLRFVCYMCCLYSCWDTTCYNNRHILHFHSQSMIHFLCDMRYFYNWLGTEYHIDCHKHQALYILLKSWNKRDRYERKAEMWCEKKWNVYFTSLTARDSWNISKKTMSHIVHQGYNSNTTDQFSLVVWNLTYFDNVVY